VRKPCSTSHGTEAFPRHVGSMKSGTRLCAKKGVRDIFCAKSIRVPLFMEPRPFPGVRVPWKVEHGCAAKEVLERHCAQTVFHFSWNRGPSQACWFHEKWNTVVRPKRRWRELVRKLCSTFHGTAAFPRHVGSMKSGTRLCAKRGVREALCANRVPLFMEPKPFAGMLVP